MQEIPQPPADVRAYGFSEWPPDHDQRIPQLYVSPAEAAEQFWGGGTEPLALVMQNPHGAITRHPWSDYDSAMISLFAADVVVSMFEEAGTQYRHPRHALTISSSCIRHSSTAALAELRPVRKHIHRLARRADDCLDIDRMLRKTLWSVAMTAWCAELVVQSSRTSVDRKRLWGFSEGTVRLAAELDPHFANRLKLWLDEYLRTGAYFVEHARRPEE